MLGVVQPLVHGILTGKYNGKSGKTPRYPAGSRLDSNRKRSVAARFKVQNTRWVHVTECFVNVYNFD